MELVKGATLFNDAVNGKRFKFKLKLNSSFIMLSDEWIVNVLKTSANKMVALLLTWERIKFTSLSSSPLSFHSPNSSSSSQYSHINPFDFYTPKAPRAPLIT